MKQVTVQTATREQLEYALTKSVELQAHYAKLLNMYDGGERIAFKGPNEWLTRLATLDVGHNDTGGN